MNDAVQAAAYAQADFTEPHNRFVELFRQSLAGAELCGTVLDLGCGAADICVRLANAFPAIKIEGIDGAEQMLALGRDAVAHAGLSSRIYLTHSYLPRSHWTNRSYCAITSNSLLHHLADPLVLWRSIAAVAHPGAHIFIMDLMRPADEATARAMVDLYVADEPDILRHDFYHSLLAAYRLEEIADQLREVGINFLRIEQVSDRHFTVRGVWR